MPILLLLLALVLVPLEIMAMTPNPSLQLRPYQASDQAAVLAIFDSCLTEEWSKYHDAKYLPNAKRYVESCVAPGSDLNNIPKVYEQFWVLEDKSNGTPKVVGMCGLQVLNKSTGELRRNLFLPPYRRQGWGTKTVMLCQHLARDLQLSKMVCSTPEHGADVLAFYKKLGFVDTGRRQDIHQSPIQEVFFEWTVE